MTIVPSRLYRAVLSLACAAIASVVVCAVVIACNYEQFSNSFSGWYLFIRGAVIVIAFAWVLSLPLVLCVQRLDGWRLWLLAVSGAILGPALSFILNLCIRLAEPSQKFDLGEGWKVEGVVTAISVTASALYLGWLKFRVNGQNPN